MEYFHGIVLVKCWSTEAECFSNEISNYKNNKFFDIEEKPNDAKVEIVGIGGRVERQELKKRRTT